MKKKVGIAVWLFCLCLGAAKYPPGLRWREIEGKGFTIVFPAGHTSKAMEALTAAGNLHKQLAAFWRTPLRGRVRIVIDDSTDQANGFATFYPFNLIGMNLAEPPPDSEIAGSRNWIDLVLAHELTHIFSLNAGAPLFRLGRRLFGSLTVLYPTVQMPAWAIEGLAVEGESRFTGDGRLNHAPYRLMLDAARCDDSFPGWNRIAGLPAAWPGPTGKYLFGAGFMEFLASKYGADNLRRYVERFSTRLLTLGTSRDFRKLFGKPLGELWEEYRGGASSSNGLKAEPITKNAFSQQYPHLLGENKLVFYRRDYRSRGEVVMLDLKTGREKILFKMDAVNGLGVSPREDRIYVSASEIFHAFNDFSDLYEFDIKKRRLKRLSRGQRLSQPVKEQNSDQVYCIQRRDGGYCLVVFDTGTGRTRALSRPFAGMAQPAVNPNGQMIAATVKPEGGPWGIAFFWKDGEIDRFISVPGSNLSQPRWQDDDKLLFIMSGKETSHLASYSLTMGSGWRIEDPQLAGLRQFDLSRASREIIYTFYSGRGEEIARRPLAWIPLTAMEITAASGIPETDTSPAAPAPRSRPYRFWRDLLPRWWSPALRSGGDELQAGLVTGGQDVLGIHRYNVEGYYGFSSRRANVLFQYIYDGLLSTLSVQYRDTNDYYRGSRNSLRTREFTFASLWPLRIRKRSQLHAYADLHLEKRIHIDHGSEFVLGDMMNGMRLGMRFNSARAWYDSISPADGVTLAVQGAVHPAGLGNELASRALQADARAYLPLFRPGVLALRLAAAKNWESGSLYYDMGGIMAEGGLGNSRPFRLLRGFDTGRFYGNRGWQFNAEYRLPLIKLDKGVLPSLALDRLWFDVFIDAGRLASRGYVPPVAYSAGAEAVLRLAFGGTAAVDLALGFTHGFGPEKTYKLYLRTGRSF